MARRNYSRMLFSLQNNGGDEPTPDDGASRLPQVYDDILKGTNPAAAGKIPVNVVTTPYFTAATLDKTQDLIEEEIVNNEHHPEFNAEWTRNDQHSVNARLLPPDDLKEVFSPVNVSVSRDENGTRIVTEQTQTEAASDVVTFNVEQGYAAIPIDTGTTIQVNTVSHYDNQGLMTHNSIHRNITGQWETPIYNNNYYKKGANIDFEWTDLTATAGQDDVYENGMLRNRTFFSSIKKTDHDHPYNITVDSKKSFDVNGLAWGYRTADVDFDADENQQIKHEMSSVTRLPDGTYSFVTSSTVKNKVTDKSVATSDASYISADSAGEQLLSGTSTKMENGEKTVQTVQPVKGKNVWVIDTNQTPPASQTPPDNQAKNNAAVIMMRRSHALSAPA